MSSFEVRRTKGGAMYRKWLGSGVKCEQHWGNYVRERREKKLGSHWHCIGNNKIRRKAFFTLLNYVRLRWVRRHMFQLLSSVTMSILLNLYVVVRRVSVCLPKPFMASLLLSSYCHLRRHHCQYMQENRLKIHRFEALLVLGRLCCVVFKVTTMHTHSLTHGSSNLIYNYISIEPIAAPIQKYDLIDIWYFRYQSNA